MSNPLQLDDVDDDDDDDDEEDDEENEDEEDEEEYEEDEEHEKDEEIEDNRKKVKDKDLGSCKKYDEDENVRKQYQRDIYGAGSSNEHFVDEIKSVIYTVEKNVLTKFDELKRAVEKINRSG
ncbi:hypothetical protein TKK_0011572 [Trichogramma kaykai]